MSKRLSRREFLNSRAFKDEIPPKTLLDLKNSCAQFIISLAEKLGLSYSFTMLGIHLVNYFFHLKSFKNYDRFDICAASLVLACKILDFHIDLRNVSSKFYALLCDKVTLKKKEIITDSLTNLFKEKICQAEENIMSALNYDFDIEVPTKYIPDLINLLVHQKLKEKVFRLSKILALSFYRTGGSLFYSNLDIMLACIMLANFVFSGLIMF